MKMLKALPDQLSPAVRDFCLHQGIERYVPVAIDLIEKYFSSVRELNLQLEQDPETGEEWLTLELTVQGEVDVFLKQYDAYTERWVSSVPWPERDKIRLSYNIT